MRRGIQIQVAWRICRSISHPPSQGVPSGPGMRQFHFIKSTPPSSLVSGLAEKPNGRLFLNSFRSTANLLLAKLIGVYVLTKFRGFWSRIAKASKKKWANWQLPRGLLLLQQQAGLHYIAFCLESLFLIAMSIEEKQPLMGAEQKVPAHAPFATQAAVPVRR